MSLRLREEYKIEFDAIDFNGNITLNGICAYMQIIAGNHAEMLNFNYFKNNGHPDRYWIISKVKYVMDEYPQWGEKIALETYPGGYDKLYAVRLFDIFNQQGKKIGHIIGDYLLMETERNRPVRIKGGEGCLACLDFPYEGEALKKLIPFGEVLREEIRKAYYYEIDLNEHMNNSHYVRWAIDMLPLELLKDHEIASFEIDYNASITYGIEVKLKLMHNEEGTYWVCGETMEGEINFFTAEITLRPHQKEGLIIDKK